MKNNFNLRQFLSENKLTTNSKMLNEAIGSTVAFGATPEEADKAIKTFTKAAAKLGFDTSVEKKELDNGIRAVVYVHQKEGGPDTLYSPEYTALLKLQDRIIAPFQNRQAKTSKAKSSKSGNKVKVGDQVEYDLGQWVVVGINGSEVDIIEIGDNGYTVKPKDISQKNPKVGDIVDGPGIDSSQALVVGFDGNNIDVMELTGDGITVDKSEL